MKERIEYEITRSHGKISDREMLLLLQRELMKEEQFEEERYEPEYSITEVNKIIKYRCTRCNGKSKWHGCVIKREGKIMGWFKEIECLSKIGDYGEDLFGNLRIDNVNYQVIVQCKNQVGNIRQEIVAQIKSLLLKRYGPKIGIIVYTEELDLKAMMKEMIMKKQMNQKR